MQLTSQPFQDIRLLESPKILAGSFDVGSGDKRDFPFEVNIPMFGNLRMGGRIRYSLKAVAGVKGASRRNQGSQLQYLALENIS